MSEIGIPYPIQDVFVSGIDPVTRTTQGNMPTYILDHVEYPEEGGIFIYCKGVVFPTKGFPTPEAVAACDVAKRLFIGNIKFFGLPEVLLAFSTMIFLPFKRKIKVLDNWLHGYSSLAHLILLPYILKERYYSAPCRELRKFIELFLKEIGINPENAAQFALIFATLIEYDTAYRYRMEDIFSESSQEKLLANPRKEVKRLLAIFKDREPTLQVFTKFQSIASILSLLLILPRVKKAFKLALSKITFSKMQLDQADRYHCLKFDRYKFMGQSADDRYRVYETIHGGHPPDMYYVEPILE